jgi:hypothetical protein
MFFSPLQLLPSNLSEMIENTAFAEGSNSAIAPMIIAYAAAQLLQKMLF